MIVHKKNEMMKIKTMKTITMQKLPKHKKGQIQKVVGLKNQEKLGLGTKSI